MTGSYFITGTDTDVGKTLVTAALLSRLLKGGVDAVPMKPVQTGCPRRADGTLADLDLEICLSLNGLALPDDERRLIAPYRFEPACSPHLAAAKGGIHIEFTKICAAADELMQRHQTVLIEGAGGILVPIDEDKTMLDLMIELGLPVIIASRPGLGTINHTLLTISELHKAGLKVHGVVFCETRPMSWGDIERDNWRTIERFGKTKVLGCVPYLPGLADGALTPEGFAAAIENKLPMLM